MDTKKIKSWGATKAAKAAYLAARNNPSATQATKDAKHAAYKRAARVSLHEVMGGTPRR